MIVATAAALAFASAGPTVAIQDDFFKKSALTVRRGTKVTWIWKGKDPHNVKVKKGPVKFGSSTKTKGTYAKKLTRKGTYFIVCSVHAPDMKMTIKVR